MRARRWQRFGRAVVQHNAEPTNAERRQIVLANAGPRSVSTAFTSLEEFGLTSWERETVHLLVPGGTRVRSVRGISTRVHYAGDWEAVEQVAVRRRHSFAKH